MSPAKRSKRERPKRSLLRVLLALVSYLLIQALVSLPLIVMSSFAYEQFNEEAPHRLLSSFPALPGVVEAFIVAELALIAFALGLRPLLSVHGLYRKLDSHRDDPIVLWKAFGSWAWQLGTAGAFSRQIASAPTKEGQGNARETRPEKGRASGSPRRVSSPSRPRRTTA